MFPYDARFTLIGMPRFDLPLSEQKAFGDKIESIIRRTGFYFEETSLNPGRVSHGFRHFTFHIYQDKTRLSISQCIDGEYSVDDHTVRFYSQLAARIVVPVIRVLLSDFMKVSTREILIDPIDTNTSQNMTKSTSLLLELKAIVDDHNHNRRKAPCLFTDRRFREILNEFFDHTWGYDEYEIPVSEASHVTHLWMSIRQGLIEYTRKLEPDRKINNILASLQNESIFMFFCDDAPKNGRFRLNGLVAKEMHWATCVETERWRVDIHTCEETYQWMIDKWEQLTKPLIHTINSQILAHPNQVVENRWQLLMPRGKPENQILPFLQWQHVKEIHELLEEFKQRDDPRLISLWQNTIEPYTDFMRALLIDKAPRFLSASFRTELNQVWCEVSSLGADFANTEARLFVLDESFMRRLGDGNASWCGNYRTAYDKLRQLLSRYAASIREHDEKILQGRTAINGTGDWSWLIAQKSIIADRFIIKYDTENDLLSIKNYKIPANKKVKPYTKIKKQLQREIVAKLIRHFAEHNGEWLDCTEHDMSQLFKNGEYARFRDNEIENEKLENETFTGKRRIYPNEIFVKRFNDLR